MVRPMFSLMETQQLRPPSRLFSPLARLLKRLAAPPGGRALVTLREDECECLPDGPPPSFALSPASPASLRASGGEPAVGQALGPLPSRPSTSRLAPHANRLILVRGARAVRQERAAGAGDGEEPRSLSAKRCTGALLVCASSTRRMMRLSMVSLPTWATRTPGPNTRPHTSID